MGIGVTKGTSALKMKHASQGLAKIGFQDAPRFEKISRAAIKDVSGPFHQSKMIVLSDDTLCNILLAPWIGTLDVIEGGLRDF